MKALRNRNANGELLTMTQACEASNLGKTTVRKIAEEAGAARKIGRSYRINKKLFFDFIDRNYSF
ncbi:MAG: helix-turn-helix domain-containing protein [Hungatella sp.]|nr:helix-turn-helix domain-containing protein [Hungatella sp.]